MGLFCSDIPEYLERKRVKLHLWNVEKSIRRADVSKLSIEIMEKREKMLEILKEYRDREIFPRNTKYAGKTPMIKDERGRLCAVAYMIERSGNKELVDQLFALNNLVYVNNVHDGPLLEWLRESGLSQKEAAKIQPQYHCTFDPFCMNAWCPCYAGNVLLVIIAIILSGAAALFLWRIYRGRKKAPSE